MSSWVANQDDAEVMSSEYTHFSHTYETPVPGVSRAPIKNKKRSAEASKGSACVDLTGKRFSQLLVTEKTEKRDYKGSVIWKCLCDCGTECMYSEDDLVHHEIKSCGCYRSNVLSHNLNKGLHRIEGTCLERLCITKARADSKSGYVGIYIAANGSYRVSIGLQGKRHYLGTYHSLDEAVKARKRGEELHMEFLEKMNGNHSESKM